MSEQTKKYCARGTWRGGIKTFHLHVEASDQFRATGIAQEQAGWKGFDTMRAQPIERCPEAEEYVPLSRAQSLGRHCTCADGEVIGLGNLCLACREDAIRP